MPSEIAASGYKLVLLDVDNTLVPWRGEEFSPEVSAWVADAKAAGLQLCIISNTKRPERLARLSEILGIEAMRGKFKPSREMFLAAMKKFNSEPAQTLMIGDQLFTDILGGNRSGIATIWVRQMGESEFAGTRHISRRAERLVTGRLYQALKEEDDDLPIVPREGIFQRRIVRQVMKFLIVGGSSFAIDMTIRFLLLRVAHWNGELLAEPVGRWMLEHFPAALSHIKEPAKAAVYPAAALAGCIAILNSFYWNRRWTFGIHGKDEMRQQVRRFFILSISVLIINALISGSLNNVLPGHPNRSLFVATFVATAVGAVCNFLGQRLWAFRRAK
ncbi:MAG: YqeG family HAD IIIA-type phosphatase [Chthonomonas sp.]|nr:YqeG family HAD IIIA-type phosphatase [Chthonomonas sp.]